nr:MAG TPA_asm: hypothetical protein [Caudoviricetes sp.]
MNYVIHLLSTIYRSKTIIHTPYKCYIFANFRQKFHTKSVYFAKEYIKTIQRY